MKVLFLDDSFISKCSYQAYGGYCVDDQSIRSLCDEIRALKRKKRIPSNVELKWSPSRGHYLRTRFKASRQELYRAALKILRNHNARLFCTIHDLSQCYGVAMHGWTIDKAKLWAAKEQMKFLAERFQHTFLETEKTHGMIVADNYASRKGEKSIIKQAATDLIEGTLYQRLDRISMIPLMADSRYCIPIQLADLITGITVAFFASNRYAIELFPEIAPMFAYNPRIFFASSYTAAVLGVGIKLFPANLRNKKNVKDVLDTLDSKYKVYDKKIALKKAK